MTPEERRREMPLPTDARIFRYGHLTSDGAAKEPQPFTFDGQTYYPGPNAHWKTTIDGMNTLAKKGMLIKSGPKGLAWKKYWDNFPASALDNVWPDTQSGGFNEAKLYVVQTTTKTISRCMLMSTRPGDIVLDITCASHDRLKPFGPSPHHAEATPIQDRRPTYDCRDQTRGHRLVSAYRP